MAETHTAIERAVLDLEAKIGKIRENVADIDQQIKSTSVDNVEKIESELEELRNRYYEIRAKELIGEFDERQRKEVEESIQKSEKRLKADNDQLKNLVGIRHALEAEFKRIQASIEQHQSVLERLEFEDLKADRHKIAEEINDFERRLDELFVRVSSYNARSTSLVTAILTREYRLRGISSGSKFNGDLHEKVSQLAEPFDLNCITNSLVQRISELLKDKLTA